MFCKCFVFVVKVGNLFSFWGRGRLYLAKIFVNLVVIFVGVRNVFGFWFVKNINIFFWYISGLIMVIVKNCC